MSSAKPESVPPEDPSSTHSVLLPAPVPQVNPWTQRKSSVTSIKSVTSSKPVPSTSKPTNSEKGNLLNQPKASEFLENDKENAKNLSPNEGPKNKAKFSRTEKWLPYTEAEIELSSNKPKPKSKSKKKKSKSKTNGSREGNENHTNNSSNNSSYNSSAKDSTTNKHKGKDVAGKDTGSVKANKSFSEKPTKSPTDVVKSAEGSTTLSSPVKTSNDTQDNSKPLDSAGASSDSETLSQDTEKLTLADDNNSGAGTTQEQDAKALEDVSHDKKYPNNHRNNYKHKNGFKQRNKSFYDNNNYGGGASYGNNFGGFNKYNSKYNNNNNYRNQYPPVNNFGAPYYGQVPYMNPFYAAASMGYVNPMYFQNPIAPVQFGSQPFDPSLKFKPNNSAGYSSDRSYTENDSAASSNSPSRRTSSVGPQAPLPKFGSPTPQHLQQPFFPNNFTGSPSGFAQPFVPQFPPHPLGAGFQQLFIPQIPLQPFGDPRIGAVIKQITYYFSVENLVKDQHLKGLMNKTTGGVPLNALLQFNRLKILVFREAKPTLSKEEEVEVLDVLRTAIEQIPSLELIEDGDEVKLKEDWQKWILSSK